METAFDHFLVKYSARKWAFSWTRPVLFTKKLGFGMRSNDISDHFPSDRNS
jgi:hypothetical protein